MTCRVVPTLAVSTVIVVERKALFLVSGGQLTRSRSPQAISIDANKSATKVVRQIMLGLCLRLLKLRELTLNEKGLLSQLRCHTLQQ
jgi:hypothetical protein